MFSRLDFADALLQARRKKSYTQEMAADLCGLSLRHYQAMEAGKVNPRMDVFVRVCDAMDLHLDDFRSL